MHYTDGVKHDLLLQLSVLVATVLPGIVVSHGVTQCHVMSSGMKWCHMVSHSVM